MQWYKTLVKCVFLNQILVLLIPFEGTKVRVVTPIFISKKA